MAKFNHISDTDWGWITSMAASIRQGRSPMFKPFDTVKLSGDQFLQIVEELQRIPDMLDRGDVDSICAAIEAQVKARKAGENVQA